MKRIILLPLAYLLAGALLLAGCTAPQTKTGKGAAIGTGSRRSWRRPGASDRP